MRFLGYISIMSQNLDKLGLKSIVDRYDLFFIDIWGVVHNGINLHTKAIETLIEIDKSNKLILIEGFRPSNPSQIEDLALLIILHPLKSKLVQCKPDFDQKTCLVAEIRPENTRFIKTDLGNHDPSNK